MTGSSLSSSNFRRRSLHTKEAMTQRSEVAATQWPHPDWSPFHVAPGPKFFPRHRGPLALPRGPRPCSARPEPSLSVFPALSAAAASPGLQFDLVRNVSYRKRGFTVYRC